MEPRKTSTLLMRGVLGGLAGTTAMTCTLWLERRLRANADGPVDYDSSDQVVISASRAIHWTPSTTRQQRMLFLLVHWGYGSAVGVGRVATGALLPSRTAANLAFYAACQAMAMSLFPIYGDTPPPWRWTPQLIASSLFQHLVYVIAVDAALQQLAASRVILDA